MGLIPAVEVLVATRVIQESIRDQARTFQIREFVEKGGHYGMRTFDQALLRLVNQGLITWEVALTAASSPADLDLQRRMGVADLAEAGGAAGTRVRQSHRATG